MAVLSDTSILKLLKEGALTIEPFYRESLQPASYDMSLDAKILVGPTRDARGSIVDLSQVEGHSYAIRNGQFVGVLTEEAIRLPLNICARFGLRSSVTRQGLIAFGGIQVDPGWRGKLAIELINVGPEPITLALNESMFTVEFQALDSEVRKGYEGEYQGQTEFPASQVNFILSAQTASLAELADLRTEVAAAGERFENLEELQEDIEELLSEYERHRPISDFTKKRLEQARSRLAGMARLTPASEVARRMGLKWH